MIAEHGAQVLSWRCNGRERLYLSPSATFAAGQAIRGGVPVIFPQFSDRGPGLRHGFARLRSWHLQSGSDVGEARFVLGDDAQTRAHWPHPFLAELSVDLLPDALSIGLRVVNSGADALAFTAALHTYLRVEDLGATRLQGLEGAAFLDSIRGGTPGRDESSLRLDGEIDRIYPDVRAPLRLVDGDASLRIEQSGFRDVVVWNPGAELAARLPDLGPGEHARFVCVEAACVVEPVRLAPGEGWEGRQRLMPPP